MHNCGPREVPNWVKRVKNSIYLVQVVQGAPKWLEQGGTRLERYTGNQDWPFWPHCTTLNAQMWSQRGSNLGSKTAFIEFMVPQCIAMYCIAMFWSKMFLNFTYNRLNQLCLDDSSNGWTPLMAHCDMEAALAYARILEVLSNPRNPLDSFSIQAWFLYFLRVFWLT